MRVTGHGRVTVDFFCPETPPPTAETRKTHTKLFVPRVHGVLKIDVLKMSFSVNTYIQGR